MSSCSCGVMRRSSDGLPHHMGADRLRGNASLRQLDARRLERAQKNVAREIFVLDLAQIGERIEPPKLRVDVARMAHDEAALRQSLEKSREQRGKIRPWMEIVDPGEGRIGSQPERRRALAKAAAQHAQ